METYHPKLDQFGQKVLIKEPSVPTNTETWYDSNKISSFTPNSPAPRHWNGISTNKINHSPTQYHYDESKDKPFVHDPLKRSNAGMVVLGKDKRIVLVSPTNKFGNYDYTFAKGQQDLGESFPQTAMREHFEETGLHAQPIHHLGDYHRHNSITRMYLGIHKGGNPSDFSWETQKLSLVPLHEAHKFLHTNTDQRILHDLKLHLAHQEATHHLKSLIK